MKFILAIMGSPRSNGNTARLLNLLNSQLPNDCVMEIINLNEFEINGCSGCSLCQQNTNNFECVQKDGMNAILKKIIQADAVLYATPLYGHNYSGQMKIFLDRHVPLFKFIEGNDRAVDEMKILSAIEQKPVGLIVSCQGPTENNTELIQLLFDKFCESSLACCKGKFIFPFCQLEAATSQYDNKVFEDILCSIF